MAYRNEGLIQGVSMARIETTGGDVYYTIPNCDCGLTGGCSKCQPGYRIVLENRYTKYECPDPTDWKEIDESKFRDPKLEAFLRKKGLLKD